MQDINEYVLSKLNATNTKDRRPTRRWPKLNQLLFDLGVLESKQEEDVNFVRQKILELEQQFDLVIISEKMTQGLILLKDLMCWKLDDITFLKQNERKPSLKKGMTDFSRAKLKEWLWAEYMIYDHFVEKFARQKKQYIDQVGRKKFFDNVQKLESANKKVYSECVIAQTDNKHGLKGPYKMALDRVLGYKVNENRTWCKFYAISEPYFTSLLREKQFHNNTARIKR